MSFPSRAALLAHFRTLSCNLADSTPLPFTLRVDFNSSCTQNDHVAAMAIIKHGGKEKRKKKRRQKTCLPVTMETADTSGFTALSPNVL